MLCDQSALFVITALNKQVIDPQWAESTNGDTLFLRDTETPSTGSQEAWVRPTRPSWINTEDKKGMIKNTNAALISSLVITLLRCWNQLLPT